MDSLKKAETVPHIYFGERTMKASYLLVVVIGLSGLATLSMPAVAGWDGLLDRVGEQFSKTIEDRLSGTSEKAVGKVFDKMDETVDCAAGDEKCVRRAGEEGKKTVIVQPGGGSATAKCVATDIGCLKEAQARGQTVEIVAEERLDTLRCSSRDTSCLERAGKLGKKVQVTN